MPRRECSSPLLLYPVRSIFGHGITLQYDHLPSVTRNVTRGYLRTFFTDFLELHHGEVRRRHHGPISSESALLVEGGVDLSGSRAGCSKSELLAIVEAVDSVAHRLLSAPQVEDEEGAGHHSPEVPGSKKAPGWPLEAPRAKGQNPVLCLSSNALPYR